MKNKTSKAILKGLISGLVFFFIIVLPLLETMKKTEIQLSKSEEQHFPIIYFKELK